MSLILGLSRISNPFHSNTSQTPTSVPAQLPQLIALEATTVQQGATSSPVCPTVTAESNPPLRQTTVSAGSTPLVLPNTQQPQVIGYSVEERSLDVYTFGDGGQERVIVAGIHGGDEWNTVTLANQLIPI